MSKISDWIKANPEKYLEIQHEATLWCFFKFVENHFPGVTEEQATLYFKNNIGFNYELPAELNDKWASWAENHEKYWLAITDWDYDSDDGTGGLFRVPYGAK